MIAQHTEQWVTMKDGVRLFVRTDGLNLNGTDQAKRGAVLFVHPPLLTSFNFVKMVNLLSGVVPVITFDVRGHGQSEPSQCPVTYEQIVDDLVSIADYFQLEYCCIFGYSTGGGVALQAMSSHPHRFGGSAIASGMARVEDVKLFTRFMIAIGLASPKRIHWLNIAVSSGNADSLPMFFQLWHSARSGCAANIRQYYEAGLETDLTERLPAINQPVLLLYGEQDHDFHRYAMQLQSRLVGGTLQTIAGHKHRLPTHASAEVVRLFMNWLLTAKVLPNV